jgi:hypothetical protein
VRVPEFVQLAQAGGLFQSLSGRVGPPPEGEHDARFLSPARVWLGRHVVSYRDDRVLKRFPVAL